MKSESGRAGARETSPASAGERATSARETGERETSARETSGREGARETSRNQGAKAPVKPKSESGREGARINGAEGSRTPVPIHMKSRIYACSRPFNLGLRSVGRRRAANLGTQFSRSSTACQPFGTSPICVGPPPHRTSGGVTAWPN